MKYSEVRDNIKTGDLVFYHDSNPFAWLIRWKTTSYWDHCGIVIDFGGRKWLCESAPFKGPHLMLLSDRLPHMVLHRHADLSSTAIDFAFAQFKLKYSYINAIRAGVGLRSDAKGLVCSEYVGKILISDGVDQISEWGMTPQSIFQRFLGCEQTLITGA